MKKILIAIIFFLCVNILTAINLTENEKKWIKNHPEITLGVSESWFSHLHKEENITKKRFENKLVTLINNFAGTEIKLVSGKWDRIVRDAKNKKIDGLLFSTVLEERKKYFNFTEPYFSTYYLLVAKKNSQDAIKSKEDLKNKTLVYLKGNEWIEKILKSIDYKNKISVDSEEAALKLVMENKADASFIPVILYKTLNKKYNNKLKIIYAFTEDDFDINFVSSIRKDWPELVSILNKALNSISSEEKNLILEKWFSVSIKRSKSWTEFTESEKRWLKKHQTIRIAPDPYFPPIEWIDNGNNYKGISADVMKLIKDQLGVDFEVVKTKSWQEVLEKARNKEIDLLPAAAQTPERAEYMDFSSSYLEFPGVILTTNENKSLDKLKKLHGKKVGIISDYVWFEMISNNHPEILIEEIINPVNGLRQLATGEIDAYIATLPVALYYIEKEGIHNLVVAGETDYVTKLSILTRKDWKIFSRIINKTLNKIPKSSINEIVGKWITIEKESFIEKPVFYIAILTIIILSLIIWLIMGIWNRTLSKKIKNKTKELKISRETYRNLFQNAQVGIFRTTIENGKILECNKKMAWMYGFKNREKFLEKFIAIDYYVNKKTRHNLISELKKKGEVRNFEANFYKKDGSTFWGKFSSRINEEEGWLEGVIEDITEQKKAEEKLKSSENFNRSIIENSRDCIKILDLEGNLVFMSKGGQKLLQIDDINKYLHKSWLDFWKGKDHENALMAFNKAKNGEEGYFEGFCPTEKGEEKWWGIKITPIYNKNNNIDRLLAVSRDITEKIKFEKKRKKLQKRILQSKKLESIGTLAGGVAHDFNNILTVLKVTSEILLQRFDKSDKNYDDIKTILDSTIRAEKLTNQLLVFSREKNMIFKNVNLNNVIKDIIKMLKRLIKENVDIKVDLQEELYSINADSNQLEEVIINLAVNAQDAMPEGGKLFIRTRNVQLDEEKVKTIPYSKPGRYVRMDFEDTGFGIDPDIINKIYDPFFTTKGVTEGTGMGLSVVMGIIKKHNGFINVYSEPNEGTLFKIYLPVSKKENINEKLSIKKDKEISKNGNDLKGRNETILIIEDEEAILELLKDSLKKYNYKYYTAKTGKEGVRIFKKNRGEIDLLISDIVLPDKNGLDIANQLVEKKNDLKVILSSGYSKDKTLYKKIQDKGYEFIQKPFSISKLLVLIKKVLKKSE